jgi:hypothetical protein
MDIFEKLWVVEWNAKQGVFHIDNLGRTLKHNIRDVLNKNDATLNWRLVGVARTMDEAVDFVRAVEPHFLSV